ncbi:hypothetical protein M407DRAFT_8729 [Tulasnella calospora MUT 4182]|uniref:BTB domain-containing protein n=1 Tax=Tulasnella calospora MUT 4182 TaxID=1051891 RepID=A0A0C3LTZ6_9AGAM|nr:hypothetical protein M407DRAFT_8729 [Tulasnella calospora MUT 4182]
MFEMPSARSDITHTTDESNSVPVIPVQEDAETLQALLQLMHPIEPPSVQSLQQAQKLATACDKYFISTVKCGLYLRSLLNEDRFLKEQPLIRYALSWKFGLEQEAIRASRYTHSLNLTDSSLASPLLSRSGDLEAILALWRLRNDREDALDGILSLVKTSYINCSHHGNLTIIFGDYLQRKAQLKESLKSPYPKCEKVEEFLGFQIRPGNSGCTVCTEGVTARLGAIKALAMEALDKYPQQISGYVTSSSLTFSELIDVRF